MTSASKGWGIIGSIGLLLLSFLPWVLVVALASSGLMFAPPHTADTITVYIVLMAAGLMTLQIPTLNYRARTGKAGCGYGLILAALGVVLLIIALAIFGPLLGAANGISTVNCPPENLPEGQVRYVCNVPVFTGGLAYTLEGSAGSSFVKWVGTREFGS